MSAAAAAATARRSATVGGGGGGGATNLAAAWRDRLRAVVTGPWTVVRCVVGTYGYDWKSCMNIHHIPTKQRQSATGPNGCSVRSLRTQPHFAKRWTVNRANNLL